MRCSVPGCDKPLKSIACGFCDQHYRRSRKYGDPLGGRTANGAAVAFLDRARSHESDDCLLWPYAKLPSGHGTVHIDGRKQVVSRVICERMHGLPPDGVTDAAHYCGNTSCFNPRHVRWASRSQNQMDRVTDGTSNRGEQHGMAKLTEADVRQIRDWIAAGTPDTQIARYYSVKRETIRNIRTGRVWNWLL